MKTLDAAVVTSLNQPVLTRGIEKDNRHDQVKKLLSVALEYNQLHKEKDLILSPKKMAKEETEKGKNLYKELQYKYVEFMSIMPLKN